MDIAFRYRKYFRKVWATLKSRKTSLTMRQDIIVDLLVYRRWYVVYLFLAR